jgi:hypothetical protein
MRRFLPMRRFLSVFGSLLAGLGVVAGSALLTAGPAGAAGAATAAANQASPAAATTLTGGRTTVVLAPATTGALLQNGILPFPIAPGRERLVSQGGLTVAASFQVTGGSVDLSSLTGTVRHAGGLFFFDYRTFRSLAIENFDIVLGSSPVLTAWVPALHARATIFDLSLAAAHISASGDRVVVTDVAVTLDAGAAAALNSALGATLFAGGLPIGTASTVLVTK